MFETFSYCLVMFKSRALLHEWTDVRWQTKSQQMKKILIATAILFILFGTTHSLKVTCHNRRRIAGLLWLFEQVWPLAFTLWKRSDGTCIWIPLDFAKSGRAQNISDLNLDLATSTCWTGKTNHLNPSISISGVNGANEQVIKADKFMCTSTLNRSTV